MIRATCPQCRWPFDADVGRANRAASVGAPLYCGRKCAGLARRLECPPTDEQRKEAKRLYDEQRRLALADQIKAWKADYHKRTYDPVKAAVVRKARMPLHVAYCQRPEYREWKREYDRTYSAQQTFGEFAEAALLLQDLEREIDERATRQEIYAINGTRNKAQTRRRAL